MHNNAVCYIRMSSLKQEDSPESQRQETLIPLAAKLGLKIVGEYVDLGCPGDEHRPELERLIRDAQDPARRWSVVLVDSQSRLARLNPIAFIAEVLYPLSKAGVTIHSKTGPITADDFAGFIQSGLTAHSDREYSVTMSAAVLRGMASSARAGRFQGGTPPLGYERGPDGRLVIVEPGASTVRRIFALAAAGLSLGKIVATLKEAGDTQRAWMPSTVRAILRCRTYLGSVVFGTFSRAKHHRLGLNGVVEPVGKRHKAGSFVTRPETACVNVRDAHPAIIDRDTFDAASAMLAARRRNRPLGDGPRYVRGSSPLSGLLICDHCGRAMVTEQRRRRKPGSRTQFVPTGERNYICATHHQYGPRGGCTRNTIAESVVFGTLVDSIAEKIAEPDWRKAYIAAVHAAVAKLAEPDNVTPALRIEVQKLAAKRSRLIDSLADVPVSARADVGRRIAELTGQVERLEDQITRRESRPRNPPPGLEVVDESIGALSVLEANAREEGGAAWYALAAAIQGLIAEARLTFAKISGRIRLTGCKVGFTLIVATDEQAGLPSCTSAATSQRLAMGQR